MDNIKNNYTEGNQTSDEKIVVPIVHGVLTMRRNIPDSEDEDESENGSCDCDNICAMLAALIIALSLQTNKY